MDDDEPADRKVLSKMLAGLEGSAGVSPVKPERHGAQLTTAGEHSLRYTVSVSQTVELAAAALSGIGRPKVSVVEMDTLPTVGVVCSRSP